MEAAIRMTDDQAGADPVADASTVAALSSAPEDLTELRLALHRHGYLPIPVLGAHVAMKGAGKRLMMKGWETVCASADETEIARWTKAQRNCTNTGLLCGELVGVDIDVLDSDHADRLTGIANEMLGMSPASRIGRAPKILLAFRTDAPFDKVQTSEFHMLDGTVARVEVLATGQQFEAFGIHPDTKAPYHWPECSPLDVPLHELPVVSRDRCAAFIAAAEDYLRKAGGHLRHRQQPHLRGRHDPPRSPRHARRRGGEARVAGLRPRSTCDGDRAARRLRLGRAGAATRRRG